jgi:hypothetical protein
VGGTYVDSAEVGVFEQRHEVCFDGLLESTDGGRLEAEVRLEVLSNLTNETLEWELSDEELGGLLVTTDLTESDGTRLISMGLLDTSGRWGGLASSLGGQLLTRGLATSRFTILYVSLDQGDVIQCCCGAKRVDVEPQFEATTRSQSCDRDQTRCDIVE